MRALFLILVFLLFAGTLSAQDKKPKIVGQKELATEQAKAIAIQLTDLVVEEEDAEGSGGDDDEEKDDEDDDGDRGNGGGRGQAYPDGYTLEILKGKNYTFAGNTVTPNPKFKGVLSVDVRVRNTTYASPKYGLKITVNAPKNEPPVITGQLPLSAPMDTPVRVRFADLLVSDPDNEYPAGFRINLAPGENYVVEQTTVKPGKGFAGTLRVPVTVNDGTDDSAPFNLVIEIVAGTDTNARPKITGQVPLTISANQSITVVLSQLIVEDSDNEYPKDFTLAVFSGKNYALNNATVTPAQDFAGEISVKVTVHDGKDESAPFNLRITVKPPENQGPVITGQAGISITEGESIRITLSHLVVSDADNRYPEDFTLTVHPGKNYQSTGNLVTPAPSFLGVLDVKVTVHDGQIASAPFNLKVGVVAKARLEIIGQKPVETAEDSSVAITLQHLTVNDPSNTYPQGFDLSISKGDHYDVSGNVIKPQRNFSGNLTINVAVKKGAESSAPFPLLLVVTPVNDPPELSDTGSEPIAVTDPGPWLLFRATEVTDPDDDHLLFAEISFTSNYRRGFDRLHWEDTENLNAIFDEGRGTLFVVGRAPLAEYGTLIGSLAYTYQPVSDSAQLFGLKKIVLHLNDGNTSSVGYERSLVFETDIPLDIPTGFTPNNDNANDTWRITPLKNVENLKTFVRVYDKRGAMVFEADSLENEWDGHMNGSPLPADLYFYTIELDLSTGKVNYKGAVSILR